MDRNLKATLSYITWIAGIIFYVTEKDDKFVRENAAQSIVMGIAFTVVSIILSLIPGIWWLGSILWVAYVVLVIICAIKANKGETQELPVITDLARKMA